MKYCGLLLLIAGCPLLKGQNLVPNPGFEDYKKLPCDYNEFYIQDMLQNWLQPIPTSTDYWNNLANPECALNPSSSGMSPRTGNGMIGIIIADIVMGFKIEYKEYIEVPLLEKLKQGRFYHVEFYTASQNKELYMESNNLGAAFSDTLVYDFSVKHRDHLLMKATIKEKSIIPANQNWSKINGCFISDKSYEYLLIGNFDSVDSTQTRQPSNEDHLLAYYFIDDVLVQELPYKVTTLAKTATLCANQTSVELNAFVDGATGYEWEDGSNLSSFNASEKSSRGYTVDIHFNECTYQHTFHVEYIPNISLGADTVLCAGEIFSLAPAHPTHEFLWEDGSTDTVRHISGPGIYSVTINSDNCTIQDSIAVEYINCPGFVPNIITPNEDNYNDYFVFENIENRIWSLQVFDRWGAQVYFSEHYENNWHGEGLCEGIYYYKLFSEQSTEVKGWVQVFR